MTGVQLPPVHHQGLGGLLRRALKKLGQGQAGEKAGGAVRKQDLGAFLSALNHQMPGSLVDVFQRDMFHRQNPAQSQVFWWSGWFGAQNCTFGAMQQHFL